MVRVDVVRVDVLVVAAAEVPVIADDTVVALQGRGPNSPLATALAARGRKASARARA